MALRTVLANPVVNQEWDDLLPEITYALNTFKNRSTGQTPFTLHYGTEARSTINPQLSQQKPANDFLEHRQRIRQDALDSLAFSQARMAQYYDAKHTPINMGDQVYLRLAKETKFGYRLPNSNTLDVIRSGPYKVLEEVNSLAYRLELPPHVKIHPVISVLHLEHANKDEFKRKKPPPAPILVGGEERYVIDRFPKKEQRRQPGDKTRQTYYKIRWQGYGAEHDEWLTEKDLLEQVPQMVYNFKRQEKSRRQDK